MSSMESQQNAEAVNFAKQKLEAQAKETQDKLGGPENSSVVTTQVVVPSEVGKKAEEVCAFWRSVNGFARGFCCWKLIVSLYLLTRNLWPCNVAHRGISC